MTISRQLAALIRAKGISDRDYRNAALFTLDAVANAIAGFNTRQGKILTGWGRDFNARAGNEPMDPGRRACLLGGLTHILEVDDLHRDSVVHPGCVVVPAVWALVESGRAGDNGRDALKAVLWGFEAATRVGMAVGLEHYRIFHNTATCGPFGSAMAAAALLDLNEDQTVDALGNAGTQAAGLWQFLETGAMSKHLHAGRGAEAGVVAADLARRGFTGPPEIFEGARGFFAGLAPQGDAGTILANQDAPWQLGLTSIKPWPSCRHTHPAIDAATAIRHEMDAKGLGSDRITTIEVDAYRAALDVCDRPAPETVYDAKFSLQHCAAAGLALEAVDFSAFDQDARNTLAPLREKTRLAVTPEIDKAYPAHWGCGVCVTFENGKTLRATRNDARGDPEAALGDEEMIAKARTLMAFGGYDQADRLIEAILAMPDGAPLPRLAI